MDFSQYYATEISDQTHVIELFNPGTGERAEYEGKKMFVTIKSDKSPEYKAEINRQVNADSRKLDKDFDIDQAHLEGARLCAAVVVECEIFTKGNWISLNANSSPQERDQAKKQLREFFRELPGMQKVLTRHMENEANFLPSNDKGLLIEQSS